MIPCELGSLYRLKRLWLMHTSLSGHLPPELGGLKQCLYLCLNNTAISGPLPASLSQLANLRELYLHDTEVEGRGLGIVWGYRSAALNSLNRSGCAITV